MQGQSQRAKFQTEIDTEEKLKIALEALARITRFNPSYEYTFENARNIAQEALDKIDPRPKTDG